jgi:agmatine deiminase
VSFFHIKTEDIWIRDYGPTFVLRQQGDSSEIAAVNWLFNAWGNKYDDLARDAGVSEKLSALINIRAFRPNIVLEGGSIDVNGEGICLTTKQCLLNTNRKRDFGIPQIEKYLENFLNVKKVIWMDNGIAGDDTDGHIDDIARFVNPVTIVYAIEDNHNDENYAVLKANYEKLKSSTDLNGNKFNLTALPMPGRIMDGDERVPASYANFYIANNTVLVPVFDDPRDDEAIDIFRDLFKDRRIVGIPSRDLILGRGGVHCITQQEPV